MSNELFPIADRELWVLAGRDKDYRLPILCDPYSADGINVTHYAIRPGFQMLAGPYAELEARLRKHDLSAARHYWVVEKHVLEQEGTKAPGITPSYYYRWEGETKAPRKEPQNEEVMEQDVPAWDFLKYVAKKSALDFATVKVVWMECQRLAVDWLLNKEKPLKFTFMTIYPLPLRVNWKEIMLAKHPSSPFVFRRTNEQKREALLLETGFTQDLGSVDLTAVDGARKFFYWSLECVPTDYWKKCVMEVETTRRGVRGPVNYARYYEARLRNHLEHIMVAYKAWLRQMALPIGKLGESVVTGDPVLLPSRKNKVLPGRIPRTETRLMVSDKEIEIRPGKHDNLAQEAKKLLQMPGVPPGASDMWGGGEREDVDESIDATGGGGGVPLLDASESETQDRNLLAGGQD